MEKEGLNPNYTKIIKRIILIALLFTAIYFIFGFLLIN